MQRSRNGRLAESSHQNGSSGVNNRRARQRALAIGIVRDDEHRDDPLAELKELLRTAGVATAGELAQRRSDPDPDRYLGRGKLAELKREIAAADGVLIASPEYCYSIPGVLKNAIDWVSRPGYKSVLVNKPVAIVGASGSAVGTARGQMHLREVIFSCLAVTFPHAGVLVAQAATKFDDGRLVDEATREFLARYLRQFAEFVATRQVRPGP